MKKKTKNKRTSIAKFCKALKEHDHFLLSCHVMPEGDAIGSILAMESLLRKLGKKTTVVCDDTFPERLSVLSDKRWNEYRKLKNKKKKYGALVTADCPTLHRIGRVADLIDDDTAIFNIDHHISNDNFGDYNFVLPQASSCGEVVYEIFKHMKKPISKEDALNLYISLITDTGSFKYNSTTINCHKVAADLISKGIDLDKINDEFYSTYSLDKISLYSMLLSRFKTAYGGRVAWAYMKRADLKRTGATYEDSEGFIDFLKYLREALIVFFITEMPDEKGLVRISFRSKGKYDVNDIATYFDGGGHKKASGCVIRGSIQEAAKQILKEIKKEYKF